MSDSQTNNEHQKEFGNYLGGLASWWIGLGLQIVLIPFVVTQQLQETADNLGIAQMCSLLPAFLFILHAGIMADRNDCRTIILRLHLLAILPCFAIASLIYFEHLYFEMVVFYALAMGTLSAYNIPSRDALLHRLAQDELQKEVSKAMTIQFMAQMVGFLFAGFASFIGLVPLFILQGIAMISGAIFMSRIKANPPHIKENNLKASKWQLLKEGFRVVGANAPMRLVSVLNILVGLVFMGSLMVAVPIIVRDVYGGTIHKAFFLDYGILFRSDCRLARSGSNQSDSEYRDDYLYHDGTRSCNHVADDFQSSIRFISWVNSHLGNFSRLCFLFGKNGNSRKCH